eukprot:scaffold896_cov172-Amphora_coffeaeformis.AAC.10
MSIGRCNTSTVSERRLISYFWSRVVAYHCLTLYIRLTSVDMKYPALITTQFTVPKQGQRKTLAPRHGGPCGST